MVNIMADGRTLSATELAAVMKRDLDGIIKHLRILLDAGLLSRKQSEQDARFLLYYMPQAFRPRPGVLDYGSCVIYLSGNRS